MNLTIKNLKTFNGMEGQGFSLTLLVDGKPVGNVFDDARGGEYSYDVSEETLKQLEAHANAQPDPEWFGEMKERPDYVSRIKLDALMDRLVNEALAEKQIARWIKTKVVLRLKGNKPGTYVQYCLPKGVKVMTPEWESATIAFAKSKHGDQIEVIYNETLKAKAVAKALVGEKKGKKIPAGSMALTSKLPPLSQVSLTMASSLSDVLTPAPPAPKVAIDPADWLALCKAVREGVGADGKPLPKKINDRIFNETWRLQDGYGCPGYTPPQGWDWSGIRDSTDAAKAQMIAAMKRVLSKQVLS